VRPTPDQLAEIPLFASLSEEELRAVATLSELRTAEPETRLIEAGTSPDALFVLLDGTAHVEAGGKSFDLGRGDFFGEIALLERGLRTATVTATSPVTMAVIRGSDFHVFERDMPHAGALMRRAMEEREARSSS
jgi:CRP-like cAMP-binding protein